MMRGHDAKKSSTEDDSSKRRPPAALVHGGGGGDSPENGWALVDVLAYIADRENSTSACAETRDGTMVRVTLCPAPPLLVSCVCVWCPNQKPDEPSVIKRCVIEAAGSDLLLLCVALRNVRGHCDCFVYKANNGRPSLRRIELPDPSVWTHHDIVLLSHGDVVSARPHAEGGGGRFLLRAHEEDVALFSFSRHAEAEVGGQESLEDSGEGFLRPCQHEQGDSDFYIALLRRYWGSSGAGQQKYDLCVFDSSSKNEQWTHTPFSITNHRHHITYKAISLGEGGLVGFVDPWRGIIVCDLLGRRPPRYFTLPAELIEDNASDMPLLYRDVALVEGRLTLVELCDIGEPEDADLNCHSWKASTWSRKVTDLWEEDWRQDYVVHSGGIFVNEDTDNVDLLPKVVGNDGTTSATLEMRYVAHPTLSLSDSHVVYVMGKVGYLDEKVLVMSLDMKERRLLGVAMFDAERMIGLPFDYTYMQSWIPKYFDPGDSFFFYDHMTSSLNSISLHEKLLDQYHIN